jgi:hypothetical protein
MLEDGRTDDSLQVTFATGGESTHPRNILVYGLVGMCGGMSAALVDYAWGGSNASLSSPLSFRLPKGPVGIKVALICQSRTQKIACRCF